MSVVPSDDEDSHEDANNGWKPTKTSKHHLSAADEDVHRNSQTVADSDNEKDEDDSECDDEAEDEDEDKKQYWELKLGPGDGIKKVGHMMHTDVCWFSNLSPSWRRNMQWHAICAPATRKVLWNNPSAPYLISLILSTMPLSSY